MSNLIVAGAKSAAGALIRSGGRNAGRILLRTATRVGLTYARGAFRRALDTRVFEGPHLETLHIQGSSDGAPMARVFGRVRIAGEVIWAARVKEHVSEATVGGKGGPKRRDYSYTLSFAVGLCEGVIDDIGQIWAGGQALQTRDLNMRVYKGTQDQQPDPLIAEIEGGPVPAFRGTAYVVFEDMPVDDFGVRLPPLNFEILRSPARVDNTPRLEDLVRGVDLIPGSGEFAYGTEIIEERLGPGTSRAINMNNLSGLADMELALDQLTARLPYCRHVALVVSWYGDDLRAGMCKLRPGVESRTRIDKPVDWKVGNRMRADVRLISQDDQGRPVFGGTPSDASVIEAVKALKARGFSVSLYPFIMLDIPAANSLPNPYGGTSQPAFPWRGRITVDPAPGFAGSVDKTAAAADQVLAFFGTAQVGDFSVTGEIVNWSGADLDSYRRMILHYAHLMQAAGGVDAFLIGSEMRGLTTVRGVANSYPAVAALQALAADVRGVLGSATKLTYAADWSEYFGHHPGDGSGDVRFHLDPLWADGNIDAVGIDGYFPLSDWRDTPGHRDEAQAQSIYDTAYLSANIEGGEGYDWYYASSIDRDNQTRTPITDGAYNKPWVFRYKDVKSWWANPHYERVGGVEQAAPTAWQPQSKPIWFTEIGCPAIDKGANQPNVFRDPKSSESYAPYYSNAQRDDLIQRRYLESFLSYWQADNGQNPISSVYGGPMVDLGHLHIWCWDARPYPDFPARLNVWSDGDNWRTGHWISGRTGLVSLADMVSEICLSSGAPAPDVSRLSGMIGGYVLDRPMSARAALEDLAGVFGFDLIERAGGLHFVSQSLQNHAVLSLDDLAVHDSEARLVHIRPDRELKTRDVRLTYIDAGRSYQRANAQARNQFSDTVHTVDMSLPLVLDKGQAKVLANYVLAQIEAAGEGMAFRIPPALADIEIGDVLELESIAGQWQVESLKGEGERVLTARRSQTAAPTLLSAPETDTSEHVDWVSAPETVVLDCTTFGKAERAGPLVGVQLSPFVRTDVSGPDAVVSLSAPVNAGSLLTDLSPGPVGRFDYSGSIDIFLPGVVLASLTQEDVLNGGNMLAVETPDGWEIFQAANVEFLGIDSYRLRTFLRGRYGTDSPTTLAAGARIVALAQGWADLAISTEHLDQTLSLESWANGRVANETVSITYKARHLRPLSPVHVKAVRQGDMLNLAWVRRARLGGDDWSGTDIRLAEEFEAYEVDFSASGSVFTTKSCETPALQVSLSNLEALFGAPLTTLDIHIYQMSRAVGRGRSGKINISL